MCDIQAAPPLSIASGESKSTEDSLDDALAAGFGSGP